MQKHTLTWGFVLMVALGLWVLMGWLSSSEAVITIRSAEVVNGAVVVQGGNAARGAGIYWEGALVTQANNGGNFAFQGVVPADCVGSLHEGNPAAAIAVALANCGPVSEAPAPVPQTGQTTSYAPGDDGDIQAGVPLPSPRFTDRSNGTVRDNLTNLTWLKDASCFIGTWAGALAAVADLNAGRNFGCAEYTPGTFNDWRLPNVRELHSLCDYRFNSPAISNAAGTAKWTEGDPFSDVRTYYWSSTTTSHDADGAWFVSIGGGSFEASKKDLITLDVWPVRGPE